MILSSLVVVSFVPIIEWAVLLATLERVLWDMIPPSDNVVDGLSGMDCFYRFLFEVLIGGRRPSSHYFFQYLTRQTMEEELAGFGIPCLVSCLSCQFFKF